MENEYLKPALDTEICRQIRLATHSTPRYVVLGRVVETVCNYIDLPLNCLPDFKNTIRVDAALKRAFEEYWHSQGPASNETNQEELEKILAKDYHKPIDIVRFVGCCLKRESKKLPASSSHSKKKLYEILAMDGYLGFEDPKRYVEYLKIHAWDPAKYIHVLAVRQMYRDEAIETPQDMHSVLETVFGSKPCTTTRDADLKTLYTSLVGDALDSIHAWKTSQVQEESKRKEGGTGKKRKSSDRVESVVEESLPKKRGRKTTVPVKIEVPVDPDTVSVDKNENSCSSASSSSSSEDELEPPPEE